MSTQQEPSAPKEYFSKFVQIGVVVADLDKAMRNLTEIFGIGPFRFLDWPPAGREGLQRYYHEQPADFTARMAFTELGPVELELIQPVHGQSIWADFLRESGEGIHHIRFNIDQIEPVQEYLRGHGIHAAQSGEGIRSGTTWMNFASQEKVGFIIEVMKTLPSTDGRTPQIIDGKVIE